MIGDIQHLAFVGIGVAMSIIGYFLKQKSQRVKEMEDKLRDLDIQLAKNTTRDNERWYWINKNLEDRRNDVIKLYERLNNK